MTEMNGPAPSATIRKPLSPTGLALRRSMYHGSILLGGGILLAIVLAALAAPWLAPHDPYAQDLYKRLIPPVWNEAGSWVHPLGTDPFGRDYLSRLIYGARISLVIGFATTLISGIIGTVLGVVAGYYGGRVDLFLNYLITTRLTLPVVLVALVVVAVIGSSLTVIICVIGLLLWDRFAIVMRSATQQVVGLDFVAAARAIGCSTPRLIFREIFPNIVNSLIVVVTVEMTNAILLEAALSFLGLGVQPPLPSWGLMVSEARQFLYFAPWVVAIPGTALVLLVLSINLLGDGIRDVTATDGSA